MKKGFVWMGAALASLCILAVSDNASASSHREAPAISRDPAADNTDFWAWVENPGANATLKLVASYIPLEEPAGGPNFHSFADDVLYEIHVSRGDSLDDVVTYQWRFTTTPFKSVTPGPTPFAPGDKVPLDPADGAGFHLTGLEFFAQISGQSQTYTLTSVKDGKSTVIADKIAVAPPNIGPSTNAIVYKALFKTDKYDDAFSDLFTKPTTNGGKTWAGPTDDGFYVDLGGVFDLANLHSLIPKDVPRDNVAGYNVHTIALDIPVSDIPAAPVTVPPTDPADANLLGTWASASRRKVRILRNDGSEQGVGPWVQVSRQGLPLINEAVIGLQDKDRYNRTYPKTDLVNFAGFFLNPVIVRDAESVGIYKALGVAQATVDMLKTGRVDIVGLINLNDNPAAGAHKLPLTSTGDVLRVDTGIPSAFPNGRPITGGAKPNQEPADVTDVLLSFLLTGKGSGITDGVSSNDKPFRDKIPYLAGPWEGFSQGHGIPAP